MVRIQVGTQNLELINFMASYFELLDCLRENHGPGEVADDGPAPIEEDNLALKEDEAVHKISIFYSS